MCISPFGLEFFSTADLLSWSPNSQMLTKILKGPCLKKLSLSYIPSSASAGISTLSLKHFALVQILQCQVQPPCLLSFVAVKYICLIYKAKISCASEGMWSSCWFTDLV